MQKKRFVVGVHEKQVTQTLTHDKNSTTNDHTKDLGITLIRNAAMQKNRFAVRVNLTDMYIYIYIYI